MEQNPPCLEPKNSKSIAFIVRGGYFTYWVTLALSGASQIMADQLSLLQPGATYAHHITTCPLIEFSDLPPALNA